MYIYNVTTKIDPVIAREWLQWIKVEHIPDIINTRCFYKASVLKLLDQDDSDGMTYAIQYFAMDLSDYKKYMEKFAPEMRQKSFDKWGDKFIAFRSLMQVVN